MRQLRAGDEVVFIAIPASFIFCSGGDHDRFVRHFTRAEGQLRGRVTGISASRNQITFVVNSKTKAGRAVAVVNMTNGGDVHQAAFIDLLSD